MKHTDIVELSHLLLKEHISPRDIVVDATMGNGQDTMFLAKHAKHVYAFDIQRIALTHTINLLTKNNLSNVTLFHESHEHISALVPEFKGVVFNLGYLPTGDHDITTTNETTLFSLHMILSLLHKDGFVLMVVYPGHEKGLEEAMALDDYLSHVDHQAFAVIKIDMPYQKNKPPYILFIKKR